MAHFIIMYLRVHTNQPLYCNSNHILMMLHYFDRYSNTHLPNFIHPDIVQETMISSTLCVFLNGAPLTRIGQVVICNEKSAV